MNVTEKQKNRYSPVGDTPQTTVVPVGASPVLAGLLKPNEMPKFDEPVVDDYSKEELQKVFAMCDGEERIRYQAFLYSGLREREIMSSQVLSPVKSKSNSAIQVGS